MPTPMPMLAPELSALLLLLLPSLSPLGVGGVGGGIVEEDEVVVVVKDGGAGVVAVGTAPAAAAQAAAAAVCAAARSETSVHAARRQGAAAAAMAALVGLAQTQGASARAQPAAVMAEERQDVFWGGGGGVEMEVVGPTEKEVKVERGAPFPLSSWPAHSLAVSQYNRRASRAEGENATGACDSSGERMGVPRFGRSLVCFSADSYLRPPSNSKL